MSEFRQQAHQLVDWMADYLEGQHEHRIVPQTEPGEIRSQLPGSAPEQAEPFDAVFADFVDILVPGMTHWNDPGWFGYFPANNSPPSVLAEMLTATLGAQCMSWQTSPAATELEQVVMQWLQRLLGLPDHFTGVIQDTASTATLVSLLTARRRARQHAQTTSMTVYASVEAHSSVDKAVRVAGIPPEHLRRIPTDVELRMDPHALGEAIARDIVDGFHPTCVFATVGTTSSTAVDPLAAIGAITQRFGVWLHVDAAYAGTAALLPERRWIFEGIELADSLVFNPHKWMLTNFDCSAYYVADTDALLRTFALTPEYLRTDADGEVANFRDWGIQLGRRFRALKLWFVLRMYGAEGVREMLREHIRLAALFRGWLEEDPRFEVLAPSHFGLVCFRTNLVGLSADALDARNEKLLRQINAKGDVYLTHTRLRNAYALRMAIGQWRTTEADVRKVYDYAVQALER